MRRKRDRPLRAIIEELQRLHPDSTAETVDCGTIIVTEPDGKISQVDVDEEYDDGIADPNEPTF